MILDNAFYVNLKEIFISILSGYNYLISVLSLLILWFGCAIAY